MSFDREKHRELWSWLVDNPTQFKQEWIGWKDYPDRDEWNYCFACKASGGNCNNCPLDWHGFSDCKKFDSYFLLLVQKQHPDIRVEYAEIIRDLPLKK